MRKSDEERAKRYSMRYIYYNERWTANHKSREKEIKALADLHEIITEKLLQPGYLKFLEEAWKQVVECRRVLKWTYAYGYYMPEASSKTKLLEFLQGEGEVALERLNVCAENTLNKYLKLDGATHEFETHFKFELINQTCITRIYFANFAKGVSNGLSEAVCDPLEPKKEATRWN